MNHAQALMNVSVLVRDALHLMATEFPHTDEATNRMVGFAFKFGLTLETIKLPMAEQCLLIAMKLIGDGERAVGFPHSNSMN